MELAPIEQRLGVRFRSGELLRLALVHRSYLNENPGAVSESNERLEFLGDALIGLVVGGEIYRLFPTRAEGELTALRSALVRGDTLARIGESLEVGEHLLMGRGEEASGGRDRPSNLAAAFEALAGALFLDQGYEAARDFVLKVLSSEISAVGRGGMPKSPKAVLQELVQGRGLAAPHYLIVDETGDEHDRQFTAEVLVSGEVVGRGTGRRKSLAETDAATSALEALNEEA